MLNTLLPVLHRFVAVSAVAALLTGCFGEPEYLEQGWTEENDLRAQSYHTSQGSQLIPYDWYLNLTLANSLRPLHSNSTYESLRYLPDYNPDPDVNPDALPIGFVKDSDPATGDWLGINCAACHTGQVVFGDEVIRIDGAPAMGDYAGLIRAVRDAVSSTIGHDHRFNRFARRLNVQGESAKAALRQRMVEAEAELSKTLHNASSDEHVPGFGRIDAFAAIKNEIFVTDLGVESNYQVPSAPVSYPFLWDTPHLDRVQWTGHVENPYARNAGQVLGVMGRLNLQNPSEFFGTSIRRDNLFLLEEWIAELTPPQWPEGILGEIDQAAVERGKQWYSSADSSGYACVDCHSVKDDSGNYPLTPQEHNAFGQQFIQTNNYPLELLGTDPNTLVNVYSSQPLQTGPLAAVYGQDEMVGGLFLSEVTLAVVGTLFQQSPALTPEQQAAYSRFRVRSPEHPGVIPIGYKARPLSGIWATGPFLHNGSVPSLYALLTPEARPETFWVGNMLYDPVQVGYKTTWVPGGFLFDTRISGNSAAGHTFGSEFTDQQKRDLIEFLKTL